MRRLLLALALLSTFAIAGVVLADTARTLDPDRLGDAGPVLGTGSESSRPPGSRPASLMLLGAGLAGLTAAGGRARVVSGSA